MKITKRQLRSIIKEEMSRLTEVAQLYHPGEGLYRSESVLTSQVGFSWGQYPQGGEVGGDWYYILPERDELGEIQRNGDPFTYTKAGMESPDVRVVSGPESMKNAIGRSIPLPEAWDGVGPVTSAADEVIPDIDNLEGMEDQPWPDVDLPDTASNAVGETQGVPSGESFQEEGWTWKKLGSLHDYWPRGEYHFQWGRDEFDPAGVWVGRHRAGRSGVKYVTRDETYGSGPINPGAVQVRKIRGSSIFNDLEKTWSEYNAHLFETVKITRGQIRMMIEAAGDKPPGWDRMHVDEKLEELINYVLGLDDAQTNLTDRVEEVETVVTAVEKETA